MTIAGGPIASAPIGASHATEGEATATPLGLIAVAVVPVIAVTRARVVTPLGLSVVTVTPTLLVERNRLVTPLGLSADTIIPTFAVSTETTVTPLGLALDLIVPTVAITRDRLVTPLGLVVNAITPEIAVNTDKGVTPLGLIINTIAPTVAITRDRLVTPLGLSVEIELGAFQLITTSPEKTVGREPVQIVEIVQPFCALTFGTSPCTATGTADQKCFNTRATCLDPDNFDLSSRSLFFSRGNVADRGVDGVPYVIPSLVSASTSPTRINLSAISRDAQGLGNRALCTLKFIDHPHTDRRVDPYVDGRSWDAMARGSFWSKWIARNKYRQNTLIKIYEGYVGQALSDMNVRSYFLQSVQGPDSSGNVTIKGKDVLARIEDRKAQAPLQSNGELFEDIDSSQTSIEVAGALVSEYAASGTLRIDEEVMTYSSVATSTNGITFTITLRGTDGTSADDHNAEANAQQCLRYSDERIDAVVEDLLTTYGGIPAAYIPSADWDAEAGNHLNAYSMNGLITEPTGVTKLVGELQAQALFLIWWDERETEIKFKAIRGIDTQPPLLTEGDNIMAGSFTLKEEPRERISQAWLYYNQRNPTKSLTDQTNYANAQIIADLTSETDELYGEASVHKIFARFFTQSSLALSTASKLITRYVDTPRRCAFKVDAKDRNYWTGDQVRIQHHLDVDSFGVERVGIWTITSAEEIIPGEVVSYEAEDTTLYGKIVSILADSVGDYVGDGTDAFNGAWIGDSDGLLSNGDAAARIT